MKRKCKKILKTWEYFARFKRLIDERILAAELYDSDCKMYILTQMDCEVHGDLL